MVGVEDGDGHTLWQQVQTDGSFGSAGSPWSHFGLSDAGALRRVTGRWPKGPAETWDDLPIRSLMQLKQGTGTTVP